MRIVKSRIFSHFSNTYVRLNPEKQKSGRTCFHELQHNHDYNCHWLPDQRFQMSKIFCYQASLQASKYTRHFGGMNWGSQGRQNSHFQQSNLHHMRFLQLNIMLGILKWKQIFSIPKYFWVYSCNNITTTLIQISRLFYFGFFSKTNHQMII